MSEPKGHTVSVQTNQTLIWNREPALSLLLKWRVWISTGQIEMDRLELALIWFTYLLINVMWYFTFHSEARALLFQS